MRHADLPDKAESGSDLAKALCSRIAPGPMMTQRAVANFGNGLDESLHREARGLSADWPGGAHPSQKRAL